MKKSKLPSTTDHSSLANPPLLIRSRALVRLACLCSLIVGIFYYSKNSFDFDSVTILLNALDFPTGPAFLASAWRIALACGLGLFAVFLGRWPLWRLRYIQDDSLESIVLSLGLGLGIMIAALFLSGILGLWHKTALIAMFCLASVALLVGNRNLKKEPMTGGLRKPSAPFGFIDKFLSFLLLAFLLTYLMEALAPEIFYDSLVYHLAIPRLWLSHHKIIPTPANLFSGTPFNMEILYGMGLALSDAVLAKLLHFTTGLATLGTIYAVANRYGSRRAGLIACLLFVSPPMVALEFGKSAVELGSSFFGVLAFYALLRSGEPELAPLQKRWLMLAGLYGGLTMGTKYTAWAILPALCAADWVLGRQNKRSINELFLDQWLLVLTALLVVSPWVIKNILFYKNPLYPFLNTVFRNPANALFNWAGVKSDAGSRNLLQQFSSWNGFWDFLREPWEISMSGKSDANFIGPAYLIFLPCLGCFRWRPVNQALFWGFFTQWLLTSLSTHLARFWIPSLALLSTFLGILLAQSAFGKPLHIILPAALIWISLVNLNAGASFLFSMDGWRVVLGKNTAADYLNQSHISYPTPYYNAAEFINQNTPPTASVLILGDARSFYVERAVIAATVFDTHPLISLANASKDGDEIYAQLQHLGITHILFNVAEAMRLRNYAQVRLTIQGQGVFDRFWQKHAHLVFQDQDPQRNYLHLVRVYELVSDRLLLEPGVAQIPDIFLQITQQK